MQGCRELLSAGQLHNSRRSLILFLTIAFAVACLGSLIMEPGLVDWYTRLEKPVFTPPGWAFGAAWSFNYSSMAVAFWRVWLKRAQAKVQSAAIFYHLQLVLNVVWTWTFFEMHSPGLAFGCINILQLANIATALSFARIDRLSAYLLIPYLCWVSFATVLNFYIWIANY
jgi:translocator protein